MRDDLRPHGHTKSADGGEIQGIQIKDGEPTVTGTDDEGNSTLASGASTLSVLASGTDSVDGGTNTYVATGIDEEIRFAKSIVRPTNSDAYGSDWQITDNTSDFGALVSHPYWDHDENQWYVYLYQDSGSTIDLDWKLVEYTL